MKSEQELLEDCLESGKLDEATEKAFREWYEKTASGLWVGALTIRQRQWLDAVCERLGIDPGAENMVSSGKMKVTEGEQRRLREFVAGLGPKPLKPPGRR